MEARMSYLPADGPMPDPDPWEMRFWDFCSKRSLRFQSCARCGAIRHPPLPVCAHCHSFDQDWVEATNDAALFTFTIIHRESHPALARSVPYNAAVVIFPSLQAVRLVTNIVDCANDALHIDMKLSLVWEEPRPGCVLPRFRPFARGER
jgi:uncharacterized OB-fold protein